MRQEYQAIGYSVELQKELDSRYQGPDEPLTTFIQIINCYFQRLDPNATERVKIDKILSLMHPEYRMHFNGKKFNDLRELSKFAHDAQELIKNIRDYKLPPTREQSLEPSLAWNPARRSKQIDNYSNYQKPTDLRLKFPSIDPFSYYHRSRTGSQRSNERKEEKITVFEKSETTETREMTERDENRRDMTKIKCFVCNKYGHYQSHCPEQRKGSGNGNPPDKQN